MSSDERRRGRAEGLRMAASLLRDGELMRGAADVLSRIADEEAPAGESDEDSEASPEEGRR